jgi:two-component system, NtrC family, sensor kinase
MRVFIPLDLLFRLLVWIGYRDMVGPLAPSVKGPLAFLATAVALPFVIGSAIAIAVLLAPIDRWLVQRRTAPADESTGEGPAARPLQEACAAASNAPRRFALVWMISWVVPFALLNYVALVARADRFQLGPETWIGGLFMMGTLPLGAISLGFTFLSWFLGSTTGQLSLAAHARGVSLGGRGWSVRKRTMVVAFCLGLTPILWIASVSYTSSARAANQRNLLQVQLAVRELVDSAAAGNGPGAVATAAASRPDSFVADRSGRVLSGTARADLAAHPALTGWLARAATDREGATIDWRSGWSIAFRAVDRARVIGSVHRPDHAHDRSHLVILIFFCTVVAIYAALCAGFLAGSIGTPVASIARVIRDITDRGDVTKIKRIPVFQRDEIGDLVDGANRMLDRLEAAARASRKAEASLRHANEVLEQRVTERTAELARSHETIEASLVELRATQRNLVEASRLGGMAEVATVVLHNVGNVLTSVNVSAEIAAELVQSSRAGRLVEVVRLLDHHHQDLAGFLTRDERGRLLPTYLRVLAEDIGNERMAIAAEVARLKTNLDHIAVIIGSQQALARGGELALERVEPAALLEEAIELAIDGEERPIEVVREQEPLAAVMVDRRLVVQVLANLLRNAQEAVADVEGPRIQLRARKVAEDRFALEIADNGSGIAAENLTRIFNHGFTTKQSGHGFGLHSSACSARMMGGSLLATSPGPGQGATFTLELPTRPLAAASDEEQSAA